MIELLLEAESALSLGLLDRAEILYRQVAGADPRNSIAVVGLARVMLERGDEAGALKQARRALAIDAENTAAQRMVQRLEEVLEYRLTEGLPAAARPVAPPEPPPPLSPEPPNARRSEPRPPPPLSLEPPNAQASGAPSPPTGDSPKARSLDSRPAEPHEPPTSLHVAPSPPPAESPTESPEQPESSNVGPDAAPGPPPDESPPEARTARSRSVLDRLLRRRR